MIGTAAFIAVELRAREPILPMSLFANRNFAVASGVGLIVGLSLFGAVTFLPIYLQVVKGVSPPSSGLLLMPMMLGMLVTSVLSGRLISRFGRYKLYPIIGTASMTFGLGHAGAALGVESNVWQTALDALWLGLGMGMVMQVLVLAVQNSVDYEQLGVATSGTMLFRSLGGALGVALFGAIFANLLHAQLAGPGMDFLATVIPAGDQEACRRTCTRNTSPRSWRRCGRSSWRRPPFPRSDSRSPGCCARPRCARAPPAEGLGESFAMPRDATSLEELERIVTALVARENRWRVYADLARRAGIDLPAPELWMLARLGEREPMTLASLSEELKVPAPDLQGPLDALCERGIAVKRADGELAAHARRRRHARPGARRAAQGARRHARALAARAAPRRAGVDRPHGAGA